MVLNPVDALHAENEMAILQWIRKQSRYEPLPRKGN